MTTYLENNRSIEVMQDGEKQEYLKALATQMIKDRDIKPSVKHFLKDSEFLGSHYQELFNEIQRRFESGDIPTLEYLKTRYKINTIDLNMTQSDIGELLKVILLKEKVTKELLPHVNNLDSLKSYQFIELLSKIQTRVIDMEEVDMVSFADTSIINGTLKGIQSKKSDVRFKNLNHYNYLDMKLGYLVGILAGSGSFKSNVLAKLHTELEDEIVLHFSLEESKEAFLKRMLISLNWITSAQFDVITDNQIKYLTDKLARLYPHWYFLTLDSSKTKIDVYKIEKMIKYYKAKYKAEGIDKKMVVFIDYVQLLEGNFDPVSCRINQELKALATKYSVLIIEGIQGNDDASKSEYPAELSHIGRVKSLKNDCDIILGQKLVVFENEPHKPILWVRTLKHRHGKPAEFKYQIDYTSKNKELGNWHSKLAPRVIVLKPQEFEDDDYTSDLALGIDIESDNPLEEI